MYLLIISVTELVNWDGKHKIISSPNFPNAYPNNIYCIWSIRPPRGFHVELKIASFDIQRGSDYLYIGCGVNQFSDEFGEWARLSGDIRDIWNYSRLFSFNDTHITSLIFTSDGDTSDTGFQIEFSGIESTMEPATKTPGVQRSTDIFPTETTPCNYFEVFLQ